MEKMAYFKEITDGQHLDDVDISVHCDIKIFDWLMCWIKHDNIEDKPGLDAASVVSILVSASFLKVQLSSSWTDKLSCLTLDSWSCLRVHWLCLQEHEPHPHLDSNLQLCWWQSSLPIVVIIQTLRNREPLRQKRQDPVKALYQDAQHSNWRGTKPRQGDMVYCSYTLQARVIRGESFMLECLGVRSVASSWQVRPPTCCRVCQAAPALTTMEWWCLNMKGEHSFDVFSSIHAEQSSCLSWHSIFFSLLLTATLIIELIEYLSILILS